MLKFNHIALLLIILLAGACNHKTNQSVQMSNPNTPPDLSMPKWADNAVIYEVNIRQFSKEGTINAVAHELPRLRKLGVDILWLMPVYPISEEKKKGGLGSPYAAKDYNAVHPDYGTLDDLKNFIKKAHELNMYVILDFVPNHTGWDHKWITTHPEYYTQVDGKITDPLDEHGKSVGWSDVADLNYSNPELRKAMINAMSWWLKEANIDGYRMDVAGFVPDDFWNECIPALQKIKHGFYLAEWEKPEHFKAGFHCCYGWGFHHLCKQIYKKEKNAHDIIAFVEKERTEYPAGYFKMIFTNNHDENSWNGTTDELFGPSAEAMQVLCSTMEGMSLIYNGQEANLHRRLEFFEKDPIDWSDMSKSAMFEKLSALRHGNKALGNGKSGGAFTPVAQSNENVITFTREKDGNMVLVAINLSPDAQEVTVNDSRLNHTYKEYFTGQHETISGEKKFSLKPWGYTVLINN